MSDALNQVEYTSVGGSRSEPSLRLYSLSTCAFCRRAMKYLGEHGFSYQYVQLDQIDFELKREVKKELKSRYQNVPVFPILTIDDREAISGFVEDRWAERLGLS
jgi:glutaredoxin